MNAPVFTLEDAVRGIFRRKLLIIACLILVPAIVLVATLLTPKSYNSSAKLFVRLGRENSALDPTTTLGENPVVAMPLSRESEINSISQMIYNREMFEEVVDEIGIQLILEKQLPGPVDSGSDAKTNANLSLASLNANSESEPGLIDQVMATLIQIGIVDDVPAREKAVIKLRKNLRVEPVDKSNVVVIEYESYHPRLSQLVVDSIVRHYVERHAELHRSSGAFEFLSEQSERLKSELQLAEQDFESLKVESGVIDAQAHRQSLVDRLSNLTEQKLTNDASVSALETEVQQLKQKLDALEPSVVVQETVGAGNEGVDGMRQEFYRLELQREELLSKFDETHYRVEAINEQIAKAEEILELAEGDRRESRRGPNEVYQKLEIELNARSSNLAALKTRGQILGQQVAEIKSEQKKFADLETRYTRLQRQINLGDTSYRKSVNNLQQAKIDQLLQNENLSNISIAQPASYQTKPSKPNKLLNLILGIGFGGMLGFGIAVYREFKSVTLANRGGRSVQGGDSTGQTRELPVLGSVGTLPDPASLVPETLEPQSPQADGSAANESEPETPASDSPSDPQPQTAN